MYTKRGIIGWPLVTLLVILALLVTLLGYFQFSHPQKEDYNTPLSSNYFE